MLKALGVVMAGVVAVALLTLLPTRQTAFDPEVEDCVLRGLSFYRAQGSFPRLPDGRTAEDAAREVCRKGARAFLAAG